MLLNIRVCKCFIAILLILKSKLCLKGQWQPRYYEIFMIESTKSSFDYYLLLTT